MALCSAAAAAAEAATVQEKKKEKKKCPGDPAESFCKCELEQMNIAFVLPSRRDGAQAVWGQRGKKILKTGFKSTCIRST